MLDELDSLFLFLPEFEVSVDRRRQEEVCPNPPASCVSSMYYYASGIGARDVLRHDAEIDHIAMHETLEVSIRAGQVVQIQSLMRED